MSLVAFAREQPMAFLRGVLRANALFSTVSGLAMVVGAARLGSWLGRPGSTAPDGVVLLVFALALAYLTRRPEVSLKAAAVVVALDAIWVLDTARQILGGQLTTAGGWTMGILALIVLELALLQAVGIRMAARPARTAALPT